MTYQEKNIIVSLGTAVLILGYYLLRLFQLAQQGLLVSEKVFRLWGIIIAATIIANIIGMILAHILSAVAQAIKAHQEPELEDFEEIDDIEDERDQLIKLKGTRVAYIVSSFGVFLSMLTLVFGKSPLVMFNLLIFFGLVSGIVGDISRLIFSRKGM